MKALSLLTLGTLITTFSGMAHAENVFVTNKVNNSMSSVKVTITENNVEKDSVCVVPQSNQYLTNFESGHTYELTAEIKDGYGCNGRSQNTMTTDLKIGSSDLQVDVSDYNINVSQN